MQWQATNTTCKWLCRKHQEMNVNVWIVIFNRFFHSLRLFLPKTKLWIYLKDTKVQNYEIRCWRFLVLCAICTKHSGQGTSLSSETEASKRFASSRMTVLGKRDQVRRRCHVKHYGSWADIPLKAEWLRNIFQSTYESLCRDALKINGLPVPAWNHTLVRFCGWWAWPGPHGRPWWGSRRPDWGVERVRVGVAWGQA